jgi:hypothetical protein
MNLFLPAGAYVPRKPIRPKLWILTDRRETANLWPGNGRGWSYPKYFIETLKCEFADLGIIFQPFAGFDKTGVTMDMDPRKKAMICGDALNIPVKDKSFDTIIADPPYDNWARRKILNGLFEFARVGRRYLFILHWYRLPTCSKLERLGFRIIYIPRNFTRPVILNMYKIKRD